MNFPSSDIRHGKYFIDWRFDMTLYTADFVAMVPVWGVVSLEAESEKDFEYAATQHVRDLHEGAIDINIKDIIEVE